MFPFFPGKKTQDAQTVVGELAPEKEEREFTYREFRPGNVLDLHDLEGNFLASGVSTEATPTCLTIERLPKTLRLPELEEGNQVCVRGCTAQLEGFDLQCTVAESSFKRLRLTNMHVPAVVHRRSSYRQRITVPCCVYYTDDNSKYIEGILRDISLDGCSFTAPGILPIGRRVRVQLEFYPGAGSISAFGEIIRTQDTSVYGVLFEQMDRRKYRDFSEDLRTYRAQYYLRK